MNAKSDILPPVELRFKGIPLSDGVACGPVRLISQDSGEYVPRYTVAREGIQGEKARLRQALQAAAASLDAVIAQVERDISRAHANIFTAQKMIVLDEMLVQEADTVMEERLLNAEAACVEVLDAYESRLLQLDNDYLKDRASDIGEVRRRILDMFRRESGEKKSSVPVQAHEVPCILVARELLPGDTVSADTQNIAGFITEKGGQASHVAILARGMSIPAISGAENICSRVKEGDHLLLNGNTGEYIINPGRQTLNLYPTLGRKTIVRLQTAPPVPGFRVFANINTAQELELAFQANAEGIGLYRTEFEFIQADRILSEKEQYERYARVVGGMNGKPVHIRLLDLGGDKAARFLNLPREENPALGCRGARLLLSQPELFATQARALARASEHGDIHVIYPMIVDEQQFLRMRNFFLESVQGMDTSRIHHGVMLEVPAAFVCAERILASADFASIGSNDLVQYLLAVDRDNGLVGNDYTPDHPAVWAAIRSAVRAAEKNEADIMLCGEMGGQPGYLPELIRQGLRCVSVGPRLVGLSRITARRALSMLNNALNPQSDRTAEHADLT